METSVDLGLVRELDRLQGLLYGHQLLKRGTDVELIRQGLRPLRVPDLLLDSPDHQLHELRQVHFASLNSASHQWLMGANSLALGQAKNFRDVLGYPHDCSPFLAGTPSLLAPGVVMPS